MPIYSKEIIKHFKNPKNVGKIKNANGVGEAGNLICGDVMKLYLKYLCYSITQESPLPRNKHIHSTMVCTFCGFVRSFFRSSTLF